MTDLPTLYQGATAIADGRICAKCGEWKTAEHFYRNARYATGLGSYCKSCMATYTTAWAHENPDSREATRRRSHLMTKYGITIDQYLEMLAAQGGLCAICAQSQERRALAVDHCHATDRLRGLLCDACNHGLGKFADDPERLRAAAAYLERVR